MQLLKAWSAKGSVGKVTQKLGGQQGSQKQRIRYLETQLSRMRYKFYPGGTGKQSCATLRA